MDFLAALDFRSLGLSPELFSLGPFSLFGSEWGPFALRWYSLAYIGGIVGGWWLITRMLRRPGGPLTTEQMDGFITWVTLGVILGGRLGYVLFYNLEKYLAEPLAIFRLWDGGMSFHGGAAGVIIACLLYGRNQGFPGIRLLDYVAAVQPLGQGLGRIANFINGELYGRVTGSDWGIIFPDGGPLPRHPSQLYEGALEGVVLFAVLQLLFWRSDARLRPGLLAGVYGVGYGVSRFIVEWFRQPDAQLAGFTADLGISMGQLLSLPLVLAGAVLIAWSLKRTPVPA
ncbi:MAG: prolipoprotein diacylglyceryl transferase [Sphingomonadales bacterium]|jgi:phosphatidylglycerol:prolipoprotein diacylglycerol transferase